MSYEHGVPQDEQSPEPGKRYKTFEHRLIDVVSTPPSGETYDAIGREADETIAAYNRRCARLGAQIAALTEKLAEAERAHDTTLRESQARGKDIADLTSALEYARADLSALRAELQRKDAALKEVADWTAHSGAAYARCQGYDESYYLMENEIFKMRAIARAALKPKEPPCQTA